MTLDRLTDEIVAHGLKAFPEATATSHTIKCVQEACEMLRALDEGDEAFAEECADVFVTLVNACELAGVHLEAALEAKLEKLKARTWEKQADGTYQHV